MNVPKIIDAVLSTLIVALFVSALGMCMFIGADVVADVLAYVNRT